MLRLVQKSIEKPPRSVDAVPMHSAVIRCGGVTFEVGKYVPRGVEDRCGLAWTERNTAVTERFHHAGQRGFGRDH